MCMHTQQIIAGIERMKAKELDLVQRAIDRRRSELGDRPVSTVVERRDYRNGVLQRENRAYRRKDGELTERGSYWYFKWREGGKQRTKYVGRTDNPEARVDELLGGD